MRGQESLVITRPGSARPDRSRLVFPDGVSFLILAGSSDGAVVGEVGVSDAARGLSVRPGRYFVRGRGRDVLFEGEVRVGPGATHQVDPAALDRVAYARLVRKGARGSALSHGLELGLTLRSALPNSQGICYGASAGYRLELEDISLLARTSFCRSGFENHVLEADTSQVALSLGAAHTRDLGGLSAAVGAGVGASVWLQSFDTPGRAPDRRSTSPFAYAGARLARELSLRTLVALEVQGEAHLLQIQERSSADADLRLTFAARSLALLGAQF